MTGNRALFVLASVKPGGAERHTFTLAEATKGWGYEVQVVSLKASDDIILKVDYPQVSVTALDLRHRLSDLRAVSKLAGHLKANPVDLIICTNPAVTIVMSLAKFLAQAKTPLIQIHHSWGHGASHVLTPIACRIANETIFVSRKQKEMYWPKKRRGDHIYNGIDVTFFRPDEVERYSSRAALGLSDKDVLFGMVAAFREEKNHRILIHAFASLAKDFPNARLVLVGRGPNLKNIEDEVKGLGLTGRVTFSSGTSRDVLRIIRALDVGVLSSTLETFPLAALEILACQVPMIMTDVGGASELFEHGLGGQLVTAGDSESLRAALFKMMSAEVRASFSAHTRATVERYFSLDRMLDAYQVKFKEHVC